MWTGGCGVGPNLKADAAGKPARCFSSRTESARERPPGVIFSPVFHCKSSQ